MNNLKNKVNYMTAGRLIELLKQYPADTPLVTAISDEGITYLMDTDGEYNYGILELHNEYSVFEGVTEKQQLELDFNDAYMSYGGNE